MSRVVVVGSVNLDLLVSVPRIPSPGETILGSELVYRPGGKGANQAVAARRLGADVVLIAITGNDRFSTDLRTALAAEQLQLSYVSTAQEASTGIALIAVAPDGENSIVVAPGANRLLDVSMLAGLRDLLRPADVLSLQIEVPISTSLEAATIARRANATVLLNAAPLPHSPDATLDKLLDAVDVLVLNEGEALQLADEGAPNDLDGWARLATNLCKLGPRTSVITLGARGAVAATDGQTHVQPAFPVTVVDATGAGDGFSGALAVALADGLSIADGLRRACAAGSLATTRLGAQEALVTAADVDEFLRAMDGSG